ncbi:MAG: leucine-rich repeat domain-containing protein, partial [Clostridiales bacterium]|nr:leucine-rich repeat domain-containing protein [Clostridiales bacterium]
VGAVTIPNTVNEVINSVFAGNLNITSVVFQEGGTGELLLGTGTTASTSVFNGSSVSSITLSSRITEIAPYTFQDCSQLTVVNIPKNVVTLGKYAFKGCTGLQKVTFESGGADGLTIETYAFSSCTRLSDVYLPERITKIGSYAFNECTGLKYFAPKDENDDGADNSAPYVLPSNLVAIENNAFMNCKALTEIVISSDVKTFGNAAFSGCTALAKIVLPRALEEFLPDVFTGCTALKTILVLDDAQNFVVVDEVLFSKDRTELIYYPLGKQDTSFIIPNSVVKIASKAFAGNNNLTSVTVPNTVELIENAAFQDCTKLSTVTFAAGNDNADMVIADGTSSNSMFRGTAISAIDFPARLVYLGAYAFYKCEFISNVTFAENSRLNEIAEYAFKFEFTGKTSRMTSIDLPDSLTEIGAYAFEKTKLASIVLPSKLMTIGKYAFAYNELSGELIIPASVITIDKNAFEACKLVNTLTFEAGSRLTTLETNSFRDMTSLTTITFKGSPVFDSLSGAFYGCTNVSTVDLSGLTNFQVLGMNAFANFKLLKNVTLPNTLREIGDLAFQNSGIV